DRTAGGGRCDGTVIGNVIQSRAACGIAVERLLAIGPFHDQPAGPVAGREAPHVGAITGPVLRIGDGVGALAQGGTSTVLEIVQVVPAAPCIADAAEIDPGLAVL